MIQYWAQNNRLRSSFSPTDIPGLALWLDASDAATITLDGSNNVSQWNDKSGNARHASQATTTRRPSYTGSNQVNGITCPRFDGTDDYLATGSFSISQPSTMIVAFRRPSTGMQVLVDATVGRNQVLMNGNPLYMYAGTALQGGPTVSANATHRATAIFNGSSSTIRLNGSVAASGDSGSSSMSGSFLVGIANNLTQFPYNGMIAEICWYTGVLTSDQISSVESYMLTKWGT